MITAICQQCNEQFEYELRPGFPRKYCSTCSEIKKQEYAARQPLEVPVVKMGATAQTESIQQNPPKPFVRTMPKDPVGLAVELFAAMYDNRKAPQDVMQVAIEQVKQAQEAFS